MLETPTFSRRKRKETTQHTACSETLGRRLQIRVDTDKSIKEEAVVSSIRCCREVTEKG